MSEQRFIVEYSTHGKYFPQGFPSVEAAFAFADIVAIHRLPYTVRDTSVDLVIFDSSR